jgi:hypothetical protein
LAQLYSAFKNIYQVFYQFSKIYPVFGSKEKQNFGLIQKIMNRHELHIQPAFFYFLPAQNKGFLLQFRIGGGSGQIISGGNSFDTGDVRRGLPRLSLDSANNFSKVPPVAGGDKYRHTRRKRPACPRRKKAFS